MKVYSCCPICGYKLCKGESGSDVDIKISSFYCVMQPHKTKTPHKSTMFLV